MITEHVQHFLSNTNMFAQHVWRETEPLEKEEINVILPDNSEDIKFFGEEHKKNNRNFTLKSKIVLEHIRNPQI